MRTNSTQSSSPKPDLHTIAMDAFFSVRPKGDLSEEQYRKNFSVLAHFLSERVLVCEKFGATREKAIELCLQEIMQAIITLGRIGGTLGSEIGLTVATVEEFQVTLAGKN